MITDEFITCDRCDAEADTVFFVGQLGETPRLSSALCYAHGGVSVFDEYGNVLGD